MSLVYLVMQYWMYLVVPIFTNALYAHVSYAGSVDRTAWWYIYLCVLLGGISNLSWALLMKVTANPSEKFILGQVWDFIPIFFFCVIPPIIYSMGLSGWKLWVGIALIVTGTILLSYADKTV